MYSRWFIASFAFIFLVSSSFVRPQVSVAHPEDTRGRLLQEVINSYATALLDRDVATLEEILSEEVKSRILEYPGGMSRFVEKQRLSLLKQFKLMGLPNNFGNRLSLNPNSNEEIVLANNIRGGFSVDTVSAQSVFSSRQFPDNGVAIPEVVSIALSHRGRDLLKQFYFVVENGTYKLNVLPPGFSKSINITQDSCVQHVSH